MEQAIETVKNFTPEMSDVETEEKLLTYTIDPITGETVAILPIEKSPKEETVH